MNNYENVSDEQLVKASLEDEFAFYNLMKRYEPKIQRYINRIINVSREESEDLLQEIFIKIYINLNDFNQNLKFSSWIYRIAHNEIINRYKKNHRYQSRLTSLNTDDDVDILTKAVIDDDIHDKYVSMETRVKVREALSKLTAKYRDVLILRYLEEKSYNEISDILRKPVGTVATLIKRAKTRFNKIACHYQLNE